MEGRDESDLFRTAFPGEGDAMRTAVRGGGRRDPARVARWEAAVELVRRYLSEDVPGSSPFASAADVFARYRYRIADSPVELFLALLLDVKHRVLGEARVSVGILDGSLIHPREVFAPAVRERAAAVILVHNHPSGDPAPSPEDREVTRRLRAAGGIVGIAVLDHVIIGSRAFYSFREESDW
ncbi:MAG: JAB domain-containing protein [Gemmatimonadota bacterium]